MNFVNKNNVFFCILKTMTLLIAYFVSLPIQAYTIGIIVGKTQTKTSTSNHEKICILKSLAKKVANENLTFVFVKNDRTAIGSMKAAQKLIDERIDLALLPLVSHEAQAAATVFREYNIPFVTTATSIEVIKSSDNALSIMSSNQNQAFILARYYLENYKGKSVHVMVNLSKRYSITLSKEFIRNVTMLYPDANIMEHKFTKTKINNIVSKIKPGDVVFAPLYNPNIALLYMAFAEKEKKGITIIGPDSIGGRKEFYNIIKSHSNLVDLRFLKNWDGVVKGVNKNNVTSYVKAYCSGKKNTFLTTYSYDLLNFVLDRIDKLSSNSTAKDTISILKRSKYQSVMDGGVLVFNEGNYNRKPMYMYQVTENGNKLIEVIN